MSSDRVQEIAQERRRTNESLRTEREKADQAVAAKQENVARHADAVVGRARDNADTVLSVARENADAVLDAARDRADQTADPGVVPSVERRVVEERILADEILRGERDIADETLGLEREEYARTLRRFLPLERESTDRYLLTERIRSDDAVANRDDFLAIVTHDLRDLIGGIVMSATVLAKRAPQNEDGKNTLAETKRIERYAARMNRLIGDLVDVASIDAGKLAIAPAPQDLAIVIAEADDTFRATASAKGFFRGPRSTLLRSSRHSTMTASCRCSPTSSRIRSNSRRKAGRSPFVVNRRPPASVYPSWIPVRGSRMMRSRAYSIDSHKSAGTTVAAWASACTYSGTSLKPMGEGYGRRAGPEQAAGSASHSPCSAKHASFRSGSRPVSTRLLR